MVGGGGSIRSTNVFAALDSLKKKKKSKASAGQSRSELEPAEVFWAPTPIKSMSWADVDDDDDYFATAEPLEKLPATKEEEEVPAHLLEEEESESGDDDIEDSDDHEPELPVPAEPVLEKLPPAPVVPKDTDRQLSKKELKKKELAELEAVLAELGLSGKDNTNGIDGQEETYDASREKKLEEQNVDGERKENAAGPTESKASKKKKAKKERASKEVKDSKEQLNVSDVNGPDGKTDNSELAEEDQSAPDVKEWLKKVASKKKKSSKEMDTAAKAVQVEAAARRAKLAAAKKKEKNHYNQQPVR
ncbi:nucleolin [Iris pallida]|uniref:Nucleolin n=1 Tax=Iris pallida TaxID=29817 RepID=A0AAX6H7A4_IRIPA|nr:nucleolin [Iris pallida]